MKIALVCPNYPPSQLEGGISHYVQILSRKLADRGDSVTVVTGGGYCGGPTDGAVSILSLKGTWNHRTAKKIVGRLSDIGVDIVNLQYSPVMYSQRFIFSWLYYSKKLNSTVSFHTLWGGTKLNYLTAIGLLVSAKGLLATNSEIMYLLSRYFPAFLKKCRLVPLGSNILPLKNRMNYRELSEKYALMEGIPILSYFGMVYPGKGMKLLLQTAGILKTRHQLDFRLLIIGGGESDDLRYVQNTCDLSNALGLQDRIIFTGKIPAEEVSELLNLSAAVVLPFTRGVSDRRGSLMAALAHHKAIITTRPAVPIGAFRNRVNMVWPTKTRAENLAHTIKRVLQNSAYRCSLEDGARDLADNYQWSDIAARTAEFFQSLILHKPSAAPAVNRKRAGHRIL